MYEVLLNNSTLYYPANSEYVIFNTSLDLDVGLAGEFKFDVPLSNPLYSQIGQGSIITILRNNKEYWRGEVKEVNISFDKTKNVYCLEDLSWLADESIAPADITNETYAQRFQTVIETYNSGRTLDKQFTVGYITNVVSTNDCTWKTEYGWSILDSLRKCICKDDGYIRVRRVQIGSTVTRYIDIVKIEDYGVMATQPIVFGVNLLDYLQKMDLGNFTNAITPYGAELEEELYTEYNKRIVGTPIEDSVSVGLYGRHAKSVVFENVTNIDTLNVLAQAYLTRYSNPQIRMELKAIDLADLASDNYFNIGDSIRIIADPFNIDQWVYLTKQTIDLQDASKNQITLSSYVTRGGTITEQTIDTAELVKDVPSKSSILEAAKKNALEILNGENGGVIYFKSNEDNQIIEQIIANNYDLEQATKAWRWNINGLAYLSRNYPSDPWRVGVAITMDGGIVADFITSGTMYANRIKGGTLTLGGSDNVNGSMQILNSDGGVIGRWDSNGIYASQGTFGGSLSAATGTFRGELSAATGTFNGDLNAVGGTFKGQLTAASGTLYDGYGYLSLAGGNLYMDNTSGGGAGLFATQGGINSGGYYSCWGAVNSAARVPNVAYLEVPTIDVIRAGNNASDKRLKKYIKDIDGVFAEKLILGIHPKQFKYKQTKHSKDSGELNFGVIAQEILEIEKECGIDEKNRLCYEREIDGMLAVDYRQLIAPMIKVIQNQQEQIDKLQVQVNELVKIIKEERNG